MNLFLDDIRNPKDAWGYTKRDIYIKKHWYVVRTYTEFTMAVTSHYNIGNKLPDIISFDHDLADEHYAGQILGADPENYKEKTGYECAKWLVEFCIDKNTPLPTYYIHSMNPVGSENIRMLFENYEKNRITSDRNSGKMVSEENNDSISI
jgi:hypothetical protein